MNNYIRYNLLMLLILISMPSQLMYSANGGLAATAPAATAAPAHVHVHTAGCGHSAAAKLANPNRQTAIFKGTRAGVPGSSHPQPLARNVSPASTPSLLKRINNNQLALIVITSIWVDIYARFINPYLFPPVTCNTTAAKMAALTSHVATCQLQVDRLLSEAKSAPSTSPVHTKLATAQERLEQAIEAQHKLLCPTPKKSSSTVQAQVPPAHVHGPNCNH